MRDLLGMLSQLRRPRLLIRAARIGAQDYRRELHLDRVLGGDAPARAGAALMALFQIEAELEERRTTDDAGYSVARHVDVLMAMMGEANRLRAGD